MTAAAATAGPSARAIRNRQRCSNTAAPVRRRSDGEELHGFYRPLSRAQRNHLHLVAGQWAEHKRVKGVAPLTPSTLKVLETMLFKLMDWRSGKLDDCYEVIAKMSRRSYDSVGRALRQLQAVGILKVHRRCRPNDVEGGPPWVQDNNAYAFELPERLRDWWNSVVAKRRAERQGEPWTRSEDLEVDAADRRAEVNRQDLERRAAVIDAAIAKGRTRGEARSGAGRTTEGAALNNTAVDTAPYARREGEPEAVHKSQNRRLA